MRRKSQRKNSKNSKNTSVLTVALSIFVLIAVVGFIGSIFDVKFFDLTEKEAYTTVYLVPGDAWSEDGSNYGAWCWSSTGVPGATFVLATDKDSDGVYELKISKDYTRMSFVDLKPDETKLGTDWANRREQSPDVDVPKGKNVYYHVYANEFSNTSDILFAPITSEVTLEIIASAWDIAQNPVMYCFDKTGKLDPQFVAMTQCGGQNYIANVPVGYTHVIFINYEDGVTPEGWDGIANQTADLVIPLERSYFDTELNTFVKNDNGN